MMRGGSCSRAESQWSCACACEHGRPETSTSSFRDLIDLLLLRDLQPDIAHVAEACRDVFEARAKQSWPPRLSAEPSWPEQYRALAIEQGFAIQEVAQAIELVQALIEEIDAT
jgi:hypothetical protein